MKISFFITDRNLELLENIFKPVEIMLGIFDHVLLTFITMIHPVSCHFPELRRIHLRP